MELRDIPKFEGLYKISKSGDVWSIRLNRFLKPHIGQGGYWAIHLRNKEGKVFHKYLHRLVAETYIPNPKGYRFINHKDENELNCNVKNLEWCTRSYNTTYNNLSKRTAVKISKTIKERGGAWNKGKTYEEMYGREKAEETKRKISEAAKIRPFVGNQYVDKDGNKR